MQPTATNGTTTSAREMLDSLRQEIERLEADLKRQKQELQELRSERDDLRKMLFEQVKHLFGGPEEWENLDEKDFTLTIDDMLAVLRSK